MAQHIRLHLVSDSTHAPYIHLSVEHHTKVNIKAIKLDRQKFYVRGDSPSQPWHYRTMLEIGWQRSVWITKD